MAAAAAAAVPAASRRSITSPADLVPPPANSVEAGKRAAARAAVDAHVRAGDAVGVGSGSTMVYAIQRLAERFHGGGGGGADAPSLAGAVFVPTSYQTRMLLLAGGLPVVELNEYPALDVAIDGADEVDPALNAVKGGGACMTLEKLVAAAAAVFVLVADARKMSPALLTRWRKGVPVDVLPAAVGTVCAAARGLGGAPALRMAVAKAGPVVTDTGGFVLDVDFRGGAGLPAADAKPLERALKALPGVVESGVFAGMAERAYFGMDDGSVTVWTREGPNVVPA